MRTGAAHLTCKWGRGTRQAQKGSNKNGFATRVPVVGRLFPEFAPRPRGDSASESVLSAPRRFHFNRLCARTLPSLIPAKLQPGGSKLVVVVDGRSTDRVTDGTHVSKEARDQRGKPFRSEF